MDTIRTRGVCVFVCAYACVCVRATSLLLHIVSVPYLFVHLTCPGVFIESPYIYTNLIVHCWV